MVRSGIHGVFTMMVAVILMAGLVGSVEMIPSIDGGMSVYELLPKYGFPAGLLPDAVKNFSFSESDGRFLVELDLERACYVQKEYLVSYGTAITGTLRYGSITELKGIRVRRFFVWLDVNDIRVDLPPKDSIYFQIGLISKRLDFAEFRKPSTCRKDLRWWDALYFELPEPVMEATMILTE